MTNETQFRIGATVLGVLATYSLYEFLFFAWLTATPLSGIELKRAQYHAGAWIAVCCASVLALVALGVRRHIRLKKERKMNSLADSPPHA